MGDNRRTGGHDLIGTAVDSAEGVPEKVADRFALVGQWATSGAPVVTQLFQDPGGVTYW
jgi:hypothetical protein